MDDLDELLMIRNGMVHHEISLGRYMFKSLGILSPDIIAAGDNYPQDLSPSLGVVPVSDHTCTTNSWYFFGFFVFVFLLLIVVD